jgi:hypothetical protein
MRRKGCTARSWRKTHHCTLLNSSRYCKLASEKICTSQLLPRNFSSFSHDRRRVLHGVALVRVELLLNSRLPELTRVCRELRIAGFTNSQRRDVADSFQDPKTALCHDPSLPQPRKLRHTTRHVGTAALGPPAEQSSAAPLHRRILRPSTCPPKEENRTFSLFKHPCAAFRRRASLPSCCGNYH